MKPPAAHPAIIGHRGASLYAPENTLAAFRLAVEQGGQDGIELDAKLSADGQIVVIHDQTVDRTTTGHGKVAELSLVELKSLDAGAFFDHVFRGERIPTLGEVFETIGDQALINVELTNYTSTKDDLPEKAAALVQQYGLAGSVLFSSFNPIALQRAARLLPNVPRGLLTLPGRPGWLLRGWLGRLLVNYQALHPEYGDLTRQMVEKLHKQGKQVNVWTVNEPDHIQKLIEFGVDGIITDDPLLAGKMLRRMVE